LLTLTLAHDDQVEPPPAPDVPGDFLGPHTFPLGQRLRPHFTALFVLLVKGDSNDSKVLGKQQSQLTSHQRRIVGLSEKERNGPCILNRATMAIRRPEECHGFPASVTVTPWLSH